MNLVNLFNLQLFRFKSTSFKIKVLNLIRIHAEYKMNLDIINLKQDKCQISVVI